MTTNNAINTGATTGTGNTVLGTSPTINTPNIVGVSDASSASAGSVGELITSNIASGSATSLTTATPKDITSISLTAGDWDVWGNVSIVASGNNLIYGRMWISTTSATLPDSSLYGELQTAAGDPLTHIQLNAPFKRVNVSTTTTVYLSASSSFATGTCTGCGSIFARRVR